MVPVDALKYEESNHVWSQAGYANEMLKKYTFYKTTATGNKILLCLLKV